MQPFCCKWLEVAKTFAVGDCKGDVKKSCKCGEYALIERLLFLFFLWQKYMAPLKNSSNVDDAIVDNIFYMIPEILMHHSVYLDLLDKVWKNWDSKTSTVGDLILAIVSTSDQLQSQLCSKFRIWLIPESTYLTGCKFGPFSVTLNLFFFISFLSVCKISSAWLQIFCF